MSRLRLLTLNCHEAWIYQLRHLDCSLDIVDGLPGRYVSQWDTRMRPFPPNARRVELSEVLQSAELYDCAIAHNITDLIAIESLQCPKLLILHTSLEHRAAQEKSTITPAQFAGATAEYLSRIGGHAAAGTEFKAKSWGITRDVIGLAIEPSLYKWTGSVASGLRVANQILNKQQTLAFEFHKNAFTNIPIRIVGFNPGIPGAEPSRDFDDLARLYASHRFFVHTADPRLEDGYNMAAVEAMAAGMPVIGNSHPSSPVENNKSGFLSSNPAEAGAFATKLLNDISLAQTLGEAARERILQMFPVERFVTNLERAIETAQSKFVKKQKRITILK
ncbi:MAG: glycosyltransferase [Planctomycetota bacterium]